MINIIFFSLKFLIFTFKIILISINRELVSKEIQLSEYKTAIQTESSMYAYFTINATYLVSLLN